MARNCPDDGAALNTKTIHGVEVDICPSCGGMWLDAGEIGKLREMQAQEVRDFETPVSGEHTALPPRDSAPACLVCGKPLQPFHYLCSPLVLETCPDLHGIWITEDEIDKLAAMHDLNPQAQQAMDQLTAKHEKVMAHYEHITTVLQHITPHLPWPL